MENMDRRLVLGLGLAASTLALPTAAAAQTYGPTEGKEIGPGVRVVERHALNDAAEGFGHARIVPWPDGESDAGRVKRGGQSLPQ